MTLSKSDYMLYLRHPAWIWLKKYEKHRLPPIDSTTQAIFDTGHEFENYAEQLFPNGEKLGFSNYQEYNDLTQKTKDALDRGAQTLFQCRFEAEGITCIVDVLNKVEYNAFDLIEIKSSTKAKPTHEYDLAFQLEVLERSGLTIRNISIVHANKEYVRKGEVDPKKICSTTDVTEAVKQLREITQTQIKKAFQILEEKDIPDISPRYVNQLNISDTTWFGDWMDIYKTLVPELDEHSIYHLSYPNPEQIEKLEDAGVDLIAEIPEEWSLRPKQLAQIQTTRDNKRIIDKDKIKEFIDSFVYPLYFFDYETLSSLIPVFDGMGPYKDYPFQYSLHKIESPGAEVQHFEYLHQENTNPMPGLIDQLKKEIGDKGNILAWNMGYEKSCNQTMATLYPEHKDFLDSLNDRMEDLMIPFSKMWFVDKEFFGSASLKYVQPVLMPEYGYKDLEVQDGLYARRLWTQTILEGKNQDKKEQVLSDLSAYCTLDTFSMVRILEELQKIVS